MNAKWSIAQLLAGLHEDVEQRLSIARKSFAHGPTKGDASQGCGWSLWRHTYRNGTKLRPRMS